MRVPTRTEANVTTPTPAADTTDRTSTG